MATLRVSVREARGVRAADSGGTSDPYAKVSLKEGSPQHKTKTISKTLNPVWNEEFEFKGVMPTNTLLVQVYDHDKVGSHDLLGTFEITVAQIQNFLASGKGADWFAFSNGEKGNIYLAFTVEGFTLAKPTSAPQIQNLPPQVVPLLSYETPKLETGPQGYISIKPAGESNIYIYIPWQGEREKIFITGQPVDAVIFFNVSEPFTLVRSLIVYIRGESRAGGGKDKVYFKNMLNLIKPGQKLRLECGKHAFPISFIIPKNCPSSLKASNVSATYNLRVEADVVNREDEVSTKEFQVVNLEQTPHERRPMEVSQSVSKTTTLGKSITMKASIKKDFYVPLEDVEISVLVTNSSQKKIKKLSVYLESNTNNHGFVVAAGKKLTFYPPIWPQSDGSGYFAFELPKSLQHSFHVKNAMVEYRLKFQLDIPNASDLFVTLPIHIVIPDPQIVPPIAPLDAIARLPAHPEDWTPRNVQTWIKHKIQLPQYLLMFEALDINGKELLTLVSSTNPRAKEALAVITSVDGSKAEELREAIWNLIGPKEQVAVMLKQLGLAKYISAFEQQEITYDVLKYLTEAELGKFLPLGPQKKIFHEIRSRFSQ